MASKFIVKNRKAFHEYEIMERYEVGISLQGTEVKSLRAGKVKIVDAFCQISDQLELEIYQLHINLYNFGNQFNHEPTRRRKLLMHKREIKRIFQKVRERGFTLVPLSLYFKGNHIKVEIALAKGKKLHDKRASLKEKDAKRDIDRAMKNL